MKKSFAFEDLRELNPQFIFHCNKSGGGLQIFLIRCWLKSDRKHVFDLDFLVLLR